MNIDLKDSTKKKDWKQKFISSSLPLEFEAARILTSKNFSITADYTYARDNSGVMTDFSVDILARTYTPFSNPNKLTSSLELLVECKQRNPNITWLFLPDINKGGFSPVVVGTTLRAIDNFHKGFFPSEVTIDFDSKGPFCYKGIEVDENTGNVGDSELKHGISQLQYALPRLFADNIFFQAGTFDEDNIPFFLCPILLTTAKLMILNRKVTIAEIKKAKSLKEIAKTVPYLFLYCDCGPDFKRHCKKECASLDDLNFSEISEYRKNHGEYEHLLPESICESLMEGRGSNYFTQFVVCSLDNFPTLLERIKQVTSKLARKISANGDRPHFPELDAIISE